MKSPLRRGGLRFFLVLIALAAGHTTNLAVLLGVPLVLLGAALHLWAKGCLRQNVALTTSGPYRFVRHPFYLANGLVDAGIAAMSGWWVLWVVLPVWWLSVYGPVMRREEARLKEAFGEAYESYRKRVPALIPWRRPIAQSAEGFSWRNPNIASGSELPRILRLLAYPLVFFVWHEVLSEGIGFFSDCYCLELWVLVVAIALYGLAWELEAHIKGRRRILRQGWSRPEVRATLAAVTIVAAVLIWQFDTELDLLVMPPGLALVGLSALSFWRSRRVLVAECIALLGIVVLCEALWLMALPVLFYAALLLDSLLAGEPGPFERADLPRPQLRLQPALYQMMLAGGLMAWGLKEVLIG